MITSITKRDVLFIGFTAALVLVFLHLWIGFFGFLLDSGLYNYMVLIPLVSVYLLVSDRDRIRPPSRPSAPDKGDSGPSGDASEGDPGEQDGWPYAPVPGLAALALGIVGLVAAHAQGASLNANDRFSLVGASLVVVWIGGFVGIYGTRGFRAAMFPLLFLVLMVPVPSGVLEWVIGFLQRGSTEVTHGLFALSGVPFLREGFFFHLPGISIEVAPECSGIRSSISLFVTAVLAGHLFLRTIQGKVALALAVLPITMFKNGVRIVSLSLLGLYVDPRILDSQLHRAGGIPFFVVALLMAAPVLWGIRKIEKHRV